MEKEVALGNAELFLLILISFITIMNIISSIWILKDEGLETFQKTMQIVFIWLLPLIGSLGIIALQWSYRNDGLKADMLDSNQTGYIVENSAGNDIGVGNE